MPWNRFRGDQFDRRRRHSTLRLDTAEGQEQDQAQDQDQGNVNAAGPASRHLSGKSTSVSDLLDHGHNLQLSVSQGQDPYPREQEFQSRRPQRFSLLKFRHASDSQLSKTARTQGMNRSPPVPAGKIEPVSQHVVQYLLIDVLLQLHPSSQRRLQWNHLILARSEDLRFCFHAVKSHPVPLTRFRISLQICLSQVTPRILFMTEQVLLQAIPVHERLASLSMSRRDKEPGILLPPTAMILIQV